MYNTLCMYIIYVLTKAGSCGAVAANVTTFFWEEEPRLLDFDLLVAGESDDDGAGCETVGNGASSSSSCELYRLSSTKRYMYILKCNLKFTKKLKKFHMQ